MLIRHPQPFKIGLILAVTFVGVLLLIFAPIFGDGQTGLQYSDNLFNKLSKGSSYFIPGIARNNEGFVGKPFEFNVKMDKQGDVDRAVKVLMTGGAQVGTSEGALKVSGDLGKVLSSVLADSDDMFRNRDDEVSARHGMDAKEVLRLWHDVLSRGIKELQKARKIEEANMVNQVIKRAIEPAYNFFGIEAQNIGDKALIVFALLAFYVAYTMWWGYAIFYMFEGIGLSMKKAKVKKEV
ncbi:MAG: hypothetical protein MUC41_12900 [Syntrophobacteraceae bacterium]|jgi:hypothetical protein|nr:hypothetical protein [Syntrophobacteraceae bacterium]